ncbi:lytic transglycosylase domain-containing protein [Gordonia hongkongensis]|uniref:Lytic transglycosylase domain-containing protein n=1 Tax=Gordonia hongkongensis TaxID=1701090 RepID=A0AAX3TCU3_9ACTN|nr:MULTISPECIES: lytic transglycosylase domain-containing protein [Gordonia]QIK50201.1 lytic transglycosylase domain-containing protein [Gordonia terrae]MBN0972511.1 lytic transglycosylase domain-containing protein [Gordonia sp. BP-119]MBN0982617.1 lytic transglycosylase domain-containing protein [Gordonia sp. BP-94]MDT0222361.1 lytic transglycosylase domain-containing protein [Gordonia sp. AC31]WFP27118.1 lytic transglycosylase domain-containing protein [Gordonia hongkongensis]
MGKHSKPRKRSRTPLWATALLPVGVLAGAATAGAELSGNTLAPTPVSAPQVTSEAPTTPPSVTPAVKAHPLAPTPPPPPVRPASVTTGAVPVTNYDAYEAAAKSVTSTHPRCGIDWKVIAGIGRVESHHADQGNVNPDGVLRSAIFGPRLDGSLAGNQVIGDTDGGELDGDPVYDRAVGPMQFLPSTWKMYAADGNGDGKSDPQNIFDAALTTANYLCDDDLDLRDSSSLVTAVLRYNNSMEYVNKVLGFAREY